AGDIARAGSRIGERLVLLVEALGGSRGPARREAEARVGVALQRGEVIEQRGALAALGLVEFGDRPGLIAAGVDDRAGLLGGGQAGVGAGVETDLVAAGAIVHGLEHCVDNPGTLRYQKEAL